ncbi:uncharacterized protein LOC118733148 [Rhagoletis pomonella]|uniref:uncharacterized protein LOC118733148 n=1 Tax=Rhagoletis pomonella TaxID=28610 RepID=UPI00177CCBE5|nr:uncharacterized protein LOC118733148 [Rhagoletis pomonella]
MFHQINVREADMHVQRFLWCDKDDALDKPSVYVMRALTFGISCAPFIAHYVRNKNADNFVPQHPRAVDAIKNHHYVDDFIDSEDSEQVALDLAEAVKAIHASEGFYIRNWASNSALVLARLEKRVTGGQAPVQLGASEKVLVCEVEARRNTSNLSPTKREVLQVLMSIFDPLGFLSHFTIALKILLQEIWRLRIDWDEELPDDLYSKWRQWKTTVSQMLSIEIPRCYSLNLNKATDVQLHTFVDAGEYGYAAVSYLRVQLGNDVDLSLIAAKSKVAPLSPVSIPRLELQSVITGVRLASKTEVIPRLPIKRKVFWTDSSTVLKWLTMDPRQFRQFVMYRVAEILENTNLQQWRWVPSRLNPADLATKQESKVDSDTWINGPYFLKADENDWLSRKDFGPIDDSVEIRHHALHIQIPKQQLVMNKAS